MFPQCVFPSSRYNGECLCKRCLRPKLSRQAQKLLGYKINDVRYVVNETTLECCKGHESRVEIGTTVASDEN